MSFPFPFLTAFLIFVLLLAARFAYLRGKREKDAEEFWAREEEANHVPDTDLSELPYIAVPIEEFPIGRYDDDEILSIEETLISISKRRIINITGMTNTEVKLKYGTGNLEVLEEMEEAYNELTVIITDYAKCLMEHDDYEAASLVLEYGVEIDSDVSANYELLGDCYKALGRESEIEDLKQQVMARHMILESKILFYLDGLLGKNATPVENAE